MIGLGPVQVDMDELHEALADGLGLEGTDRTYAQVVRGLIRRGVNVTPQRYADVRKGRAWKINTIELWCRAARVRIIFEGGRAIFEAALLDNSNEGST